MFLTTEGGLTSDCGDFIESDPLGFLTILAKFCHRFENESSDAIGSKMTSARRVVRLDAGFL